MVYKNKIKQTLNSFFFFLLFSIQIRVHVHCSLHNQLELINKNVDFWDMLSSQVSASSFAYGAKALNTYKCKSTYMELECVYQNLFNQQPLSWVAITNALRLGGVGGKDLIKCGLGLKIQADAQCTRLVRWWFSPLRITPKPLQVLPLPIV